MVVTFLSDVVLFRFVPFRSDTHALALTHLQTSLLNLGAAVGAAEEYGNLQQTTMAFTPPGPPNSTRHTDAPRANKESHIKPQ